MATPTTDVQLKVVEVHPDNPELFETFLKLTEEHYDESWPEESAEKDWREHYSRQICERVKTDAKRWLWLVELEGQQVALANFYLSGPEDSRIGTIQELYVRPQYRNRRVGTSLFALVKKAFSAYSVKRIKASVAVDEPGIMRFFENYGFRLERVNMVLNTDQTSDE